MAQNKKKISKSQAARYQYVCRLIKTGDKRVQSIFTDTGALIAVIYPRYTATICSESIKAAGVFDAAGKRINTGALPVPLLRFKVAGNRIDTGSSSQQKLCHLFYIVWSTERHGRRLPMTTTINHNS